MTGTLSDLKNMEDLTSAICKASAEEEAAYLMDNRDTRTYRITKLKDGNCWMTQNLDYNDPNSTMIVDVAKWTSTDANYRAYYDPGDSITGNYYTFQSATNGTGSSVTTDGANATGSICPTGWKLPTSKVTTSGSFGGLTTAYGISSNAAGSTALRSSPLYFVYGGLVNSGYLSSAGSGGRYWSSTAVSSTYAYNLYFYSSDVNPSSNTYRYIGLPVRCLVQGS